MAQAGRRGIGEADVDAVLMVGGSTLLPGVYRAMEARFGRARVRAWQPFEAVAFGAAVHAAGAGARADFIVHDYAIVTHDLDTRERRLTVVVPRGTRYPSAPDLWKRRLVPTCAAGTPEAVFKLVICEVGREPAAGERRFTFDGEGRLITLAEGSGPVVVPLNEASPALGTLDPPHLPGDRTPRLEVALGVDAERWLVATVKDLRSGRALLKGEPVLRLL
jgi:hypothetical protein